MRNSAPHFPLFVGRGSVYIFLVSHSANPVQHFIAFVGEASSFALVVKPRRFAICRQIATFPKAEFVAAHSRKGGICSGSQPPMLFLIYHRQHLCHRSVKLSRYLLTYVYRLIKPSCERTVFSDIYIMLLRHCNNPQCQ